MTNLLPPVTGRVAYIGANRQVHVLRPDGRERRPITYSKYPSPLQSWGGSEGQDSCSWPCWSPNGVWLACFQDHQLDEGGGPFTVNVVEVDGICSTRSSANTAHYETREL